MEHHSIPDVDAHMGNARCIVGAGKEYKIAGGRVPHRRRNVIKALRSQPPEAPAALVVDPRPSRSSQRTWPEFFAAPNVGIA